MHRHRTALGIAASLLVVLSLAAGTAAAQEDGPPPLPAAYHGQILVDGEPASERVSITAYIDGEQRGCLTTEQAGSFGGPGGFDPKLAVQGTDADEGKPVTFRINDQIEATPDPSVTWTSSDVQEVNLTVPEVGGFSVCSRTAVVDERTVNAQAEHAEAGDTVEMALPATSAGEENGIQVTDLRVQVDQDTSQLDITVRQTDQPSDGTPPPALSGQDAPLVFLEIDHGTPDEHLAKVNVSFTVTNERLQEQGLSPSQVHLHRYNGGSWTQLPTEHLPEQDTATLRAFEATTPGFSVFAIGGPASDAGGAGGAGGAKTNDTTSDDGPLAVPVQEPFDAVAGDRVNVTDLPVPFGELELTLASDCASCSVQVDTQLGKPQAVAEPSDGFDPWTYLHIEILADGQEQEGMVVKADVSFEVVHEDLAEATPSQGVLLHHENGGWQPVPTDLATEPSQDPAVYVAQVQGFSWFAMAADHEAPTITEVEPTGETEGVLPTIGATFEDNRGVDPDTFELWLDGERVPLGSGSLTVDEDGFTFVPSDPLGTGGHEVNASIADRSGQSTAKSWSFSVPEITCDRPPAITDLSPGEKATDVPLDAAIEAVVDEGDPTCPVHAIEVTIDGEPVEHVYDQGRITAELPEGLGYGEPVHVSITVTDTAGNQAQEDRTFTTKQEPTTSPESGQDPEVPRTWVLVGGIVLLVVILGAAYVADDT